MPEKKVKLGKIASDAKKIHLPYIESEYPQLPPSILYTDLPKLPAAGDSQNPKSKLLVTVIDGDPVDIALRWYRENAEGSKMTVKAIPVVNMADEKRPGGDWESATIGPEENLCRRSNLSLALASLSKNSHYPIPSIGGIYSPFVVVFRSGATEYTVWKEFKSLPIISVAPIRRPKLSEAGTEYVFDQEKELMKEKMRMVLRIAAHQQHKELCMGPFGVGPRMLNPAHLVATMWREILFEEFPGVFSSIVFAIESAADSYLREEAGTVFNVFKKEFDPSNIVKTKYR